MQLSIGIPPGPQATKLAVRAEELGYDRIWLFDSAAIYEDIWVHLGLIAQATSRIGLGTAVIVPSLRHVMTTASAIATLERLAPGRLACAFGTGYTARLILGKRALTWRSTRTYIEQLQALLRGEVVEIEGERCQMIHHPEMATARPISVPILLSAWGPKGLAVTREVADGWMGGTAPPDSFDWAVQMAHGAVLAPGESPHSERVIDGVGPYQANEYHGLWEAGPEHLATHPGGAEWLAQIESERPAEERHLAAHAGHLSHLTLADRKGLAACGDGFPWYGWVGDKADILARAEEVRGGGATELLYTPAGDDLIGLAESFYDAVSSVQDETRSRRAKS